MKYELIIIGSGPGGYVAAIRASQLGMKVLIVEKESRLGGVCLNKGCIPTKALLTSAHAVAKIKSFKKLGVDVTINSLSSEQAVKRAESISKRITKGVEFLMKKNEIEVMRGDAKILSNRVIEVLSGEEKKEIEFDKLIIATGAKYRTFNGLEHDGEKIIGAWEALKLSNLPKSIGIIGGGAIGVEFAYFWNAFGVEVHIFEMMKHLLPAEDEDSSIELEKAYKKLGIKLHLGVKKVSAKKSKEGVIIAVKEDDKEVNYNFDLSLLAVGMTGNIENLGLEKIGVESDGNFIKVSKFCQTSLSNVFAIGDVAGPPLLAHVASHQGVLAVEYMMGKEVHPIDSLNIPGCTYSYPQVASVGYRERDLVKQNISYKVSRLPFLSNGKALASGENSGFVKVLLAEDGKLLGAHLVGEYATELINEYLLLKSMKGEAKDIIDTIHPHPTMGEWLHEAMLNAQGQGLNS